MEWIDTPESSNIARFRFTDPTLTVEFKNGAVYDYRGVPPTVFEDMKLAESKGQFLNKSIKPFFPFLKVST